MKNTHTVGKEPVRRTGSLPTGLQTSLIFILAKEARWELNEKLDNTCKRIYFRVKVISQVARTGCSHIFIATAPKVRLPTQELKIKVLNPIRYGTISVGVDLSNVYFGVGKQVVSLLLSHETLKILL